MRFAKIYASHEVLQRYSEILKIRLPIKQFSAHMLHSESAEGEDMLEFKLSQLDNNGEYHESEIRIPLVSDVQDGINSWIRKLQKPLLPDETLFPRRKCQFTAVYSRFILFAFADTFSTIIFFVGIKIICLITATLTSILPPPGQELLNFC